MMEIKISINRALATYLLTELGGYNHAKIMLTSHLCLENVLYHLNFYYCIYYFSEHNYHYK